MMRHAMGVLALGGLLMVAGGCRKELCYDHALHGLSVRVDVQPDWERAWERDYGAGWQANWPEEFGLDYEDLLHTGEAEGIAALVYGSDGEADERHLEADGGLLPMSEGEHALLFYNDDTQYIVLSDLTSSTTATATTRTRTRVNFRELNAGERTVNEPDMLYGAWIEHYDAVPTVEPAPLAVGLRPLVYTYLIRYEFDHGQEHVALARGALAGMAEKVYLQDGRTHDSSATVLYDCEVTDYGVEARVETFGVPGFADGNYTRAGGASHRLNLEVKLQNGVMKNFEFDVTDQMTAQPRGGVIRVGGLIVTDEEASSESGFEVEVDGWGEFEDIELEL